MKKVFLIKPPEFVNSLCASMLPEQNFHESLAIDDSGAHNPVSGWEMSMSQLNNVYKKASANRFDTDFKVAAHRAGEGSLRFLKKSEWLGHKIRSNKIKHKVKRALKSGPSQRMFGFMK